MGDYGHELRFGSFIEPVNTAPAEVVALAQVSEQSGLDLVTFQDHPYQTAYLDTWTLLSYVAARTERVHLSGNVLNLPLRPPAMLARAAASLDLLSGGRFELGIGAGSFWDAIEAMGGRRLAPSEAVDAMSEAIDVMRALWEVDRRERMKFEGDYYRVVGARRGPRPAHPIPIWLGALKPRMLRLIGAKADGWLPSLPYLKSVTALADSNTIIDESAIEHGRAPSEVRRLINISGEFASGTGGFLIGPPSQWVEQLAELTLRYGISTFVLMGDDASTIARYGQEVAPAVRDLIASERAATPPGHD
jgi:alkanesulfonate monooxygenase SsuD/methylene tetrahydromethanopterin reductase-like flavin-dependent oxidoreductase (luciferase family)